MAKTIPQLTDATTVNAPDELIVHQGGISKRATAAELMNNAPVTAANTTAARPLASRFADVVNVKDFGAAGDGVADDTAAIQAAFAAGSHIVFPAGVYNVTHLTFTGGSKIIRFNGGARLYGISTTPQESVLTLHNFRQSKIFNLEIESDGWRNAPLYSSNYSCGLRISSDTPSSPSQFLTIDGLFIRYIKAGVVSGNFLGEPPQGIFAQSEIFIRDYKVRGVMQQLYKNALGLGLITTSGCVFVTQRFEAGSWWNDADCFNMRCDAGGLVSVGDEFQAARALGFNIYGSNMKIVAPIWEHTCKNYLTGSVSLTDALSAFFAQPALPCFEVDPAASGGLMLENVDFRRPDATASFSNSVLVDSKANTSYKTTIVNCRMKEFNYNVNAANAHFVLGGELFLSNVTLDNSASTSNSYNFITQGGSITGFDTTGASMSTTINLTAKGGLTATGSTGGFGKATADLPSGYASSIRFNSVGSSTTVSTPTATNGIPVAGGRDVVLAMLLKKLGTTTNFTIAANWTDYAGSAISSSTVFAANDTRLDSNGFDKWQQLRVALKPPNNATHLSLTITTGSTCDVAVTGITLL
jgi:hypothetical protein